MAHLPRVSDLPEWALNTLTVLWMIVVLSLVVLVGWALTFLAFLF